MGKCFWIESFQVSKHLKHHYKVVFCLIMTFPLSWWSTFSQFGTYWICVLDNCWSKSLSVSWDSWHLLSHPGKWRLDTKANILSECSSWDLEKSHTVQLLSTLTTLLCIMLEFHQLLCFSLWQPAMGLIILSSFSFSL